MLARSKITFFAMKLEFLLSRAATVSLIATLAGFAANALVLALFANAACLLVLLIMTADYRPRRPYAGLLVPSLVSIAPRGAALPLAA